MEVCGPTVGRRTHLKQNQHNTEDDLELGERKREASGMIPENSGPCSFCFHHSSVAILVTTTTEGEFGFLMSQEEEESCGIMGCDQQQF